MENHHTVKRISNPVILLLLIFLVFVLLDAFWISGLPRWGISYGPVVFTLILFSFFRTVLLSLWLTFRRKAKTQGCSSVMKVVSFLAVNLLVTGLGIYGFCIEPFRLTQTNLQISVPGLEQPKRIVHLSDPHVEYITRREEELVRLVNSLAPDMIVMTGDYTSEAYTNDPITFDQLRAMIAQLRAPLGIFMVNGNAEFDNVMSLLFEDMDLNLLIDRVARIPELGERLAIVGVNYSEISRDESSLKTLMSQVPADDFAILLYHKPDLAYAARDMGVDLYLAGHTHGGQVRLPLFGALYTNSRYGKTFEMGRYQLDQMTLYVNRGLGFTGGIAPRIRLLAPPEVVVIDLVPANTPSGE